MIDERQIAEAVRQIIAAVGEDPQREGLQDTPRRIAQMYAEMFAGLCIDPGQILEVSYAEKHEEMVVVKDISFYSLCEHHFLPFFGVAHIGYIPDGRVVGVSKLARLVDAFAKRPQLQERMTSQIADCLAKALAAEDVAVVLEAEHLCMTMRGVKKPGSRLVTSAMRGAFRRDAVSRSEFLSLVGGR